MVLRHIHNSVIGELFKVVAMGFRTTAVTKQFYSPLCIVSIQNACMNTLSNNKTKKHPAEYYTININDYENISVEGLRRGRARAEI